MTLIKQSVEEHYVPLSERYKILSGLVGLTEEYFRGLEGWLEYVGYIPEGVETQYLPEKGIFIECDERYEANKGYSYSCTLYINDKGLLSIADLIKENKDELIQFYYKYQN